MKIGIISFWQTQDNYGQVLQCVALQKVLRDRGHSPELIRYDSESHKSNEWMWIVRRGMLYTLGWKIMHHLDLKNDRKQRKIAAQHIAEREFDAFKQEHLRFSEQSWHSISEIESKPPQYDAYISGSDQVWSGDISETRNRAFFLSFAPMSAPRIAYAASFGRAKYPYVKLPELGALLSRFDAISVREHSGEEICRQCGYPARTVLDPTLLLKAEDYDAIAGPTVKGEPFAFIYNINIRSGEEMDARALNAYISSRGLRTRSTSSTGHLPAIELFPGTEWPTIPRWIALIRDSEIVATSSFHGVMLSIIYKRNFIFYPLEGEFSSGNARVTELLWQLGLESRIWREGFDYNAATIIDWNTVTSRLDKLRAASFDYLKRNGI